jgi:hypothetical protein
MGWVSVGVAVEDDEAWDDVGVDEDVGFDADVGSDVEGVLFELEVVAEAMLDE